MLTLSLKRTIRFLRSIYLACWVLFLVGKGCVQSSMDLRVWVIIEEFFVFFVIRVPF
jgi:hypothetical protein